jgi:outer membrane lipoprotein SlyB
MEIVNKSMNKVKANMLGAAAGAAAGFFAHKKFMPTTGKLAMVAAIVVGAVVGAGVQATMSAKSSAPTAKDV